MLNVKLCLLTTTASKRLFVKNFIKYASSNSSYYEKLGADTVNTKPEGWDNALPLEKIPGPTPLPIIGNTIRFLPYVGEFAKNPMEAFSNNIDKYGRIFILKDIVGFKDLVLIWEPRDIQTIYRNEGAWPIRTTAKCFEIYRKNTRKDVFKGNAGLTASHGKEWHSFRTVINPILMLPKVMQEQVANMDVAAGQLVENIQYFASLNESGEMPEDFRDEFLKWALESVGVIALDRHFGCLNMNAPKDSESQLLIQNVLDILQLMFKLDFQPSVYKFISTPTWRKFVKVSDYITFTMIRYIDEALEKMDPNKPENQMSVLQKLMKKDRQVAIITVMDMITAGIDTTAHTLATTLYYLAKNPEAQAELRKELMLNLPNKNSTVTVEVLQNSPYLKAVLKESLRIAPVSIGNVRTMVKDIVLAGYQIPKGSDVFMFQIYTANSEKYFPNPKKFLPERWLKTTTGDLSYRKAGQFTSVPFGFGPRSCIGQRIANLELEVTVAKIIRNFELSWPHEDMKFALDLLYHIDSPLKIHVKSLPN